jgi:hypothetical protein
MKTIFLCSSSSVLRWCDLLRQVARMVDLAIPSVDRMWSIVGSEASPLWLGVYGGTKVFMLMEFVGCCGWLVGVVILC